METKDASTPQTGNEIPTEQASEVAGGAEATIGSCGISISTGGTSAGDAMISIYDGAVETTTHIIETVAKAL